MCFRADAFKALDLLSLGPTCRVRKIFTMRGALDQQAGQEESGGFVAGAHADSTLLGDTVVFTRVHSILPWVITFSSSTFLVRQYPALSVEHAHQHMSTASFELHNFRCDEHRSFR